MKENSGFYVFKEALFQKNIAHIKQLFQSEDYQFQLNYSIKANYHQRLLEVAYKHHVVFDCASLKELLQLKELGISSKSISVNTPYLTDDFLDIIVKEGIFLYADSFQQLQKISAKISSDENIEIGLRISLEDIYSRFGIEATETQLLQVHSFFQKHTNIKLIALNMHYSPADRSASFFRKRVQAFIKTFVTHFTQYNIETLNVGGGFASTMSKEMANQFDYDVPTWRDYANVLKEELKKESISTIKVVIEPGMGLVADAFDFVANIIAFKQTGNKTLALLNTTTLFLKPTRHSKNLEFEVVTKQNQAQNNQEYDLVGISCIENDVLGTYKGNLDLGSKIIFKNVGAYTLSFRNNFIFDQPKIENVH